ncbi:hypothetical protein Tco_0344419 [Tanacetum coccineum]
MLNHSKAEPMGLLKDVLCQVGVTTIIAKFLILDMHVDKEVPILVERGFLYTCGSILDTIERTMPTFNGICHQKFHAARTNVTTEESDSEDDEDYRIKRNSLGAPIYGPKFSKYLNCSDPIDRALALQEKIRWDAQWHVEVRLTNPYGNIYDQGFKTKPTNMRLSKYHKLSDVISPNWFQK